MNLPIATLLCLSFLGSDAAVEKPLPSPGNPPRILLAATIDAHGNLELVSYRTIYIGFDGDSYNSRSIRKVPLANVQIVDVRGKPVTMKEARERLRAKETPILVTSWHEPIAPTYQSLLADDILLFKFPKEAPAWSEIQDPSRPVK